MFLLKTQAFDNSILCGWASISVPYMFT